MESIQSLVTRPDVEIKTAWKQLSANGYRILFVVDENTRIIGSVTDGDIRRWILQERSLYEPVSGCMHRKPLVIHEADLRNREGIKKQLISRRLECLPVVDDEMVIKKVIFWDELFKNGESVPTEKIALPVVIMAGGEGLRMRPFTKIIPKPLIPIGDKPVVEVIMDRFARHGVSDFHMTLRYKANMVKSYFQDTPSRYNISFFVEESPCGTAGALAHFKNRITSTFIVSNADIIIDANYADIVKFHRDQKNDITLVCSMKHVPIPYGVVEISNGGGLKSIREKPEFDHLVLTGLYVMEPELLNVIPQDREFHMTHLIEHLRVENRRIGVYPVSNQAWMDVGDLAEYQKTLKRFE